MTLSVMWYFMSSRTSGAKFMLKDFIFKGLWCLTQIQTHLLPWLHFKISLLLDLLMCIPRRCELGVHLSTVYYNHIRNLLEYRKKKSITNSAFNAGTERSVTMLTNLPNLIVRKFRVWQLLLDRLRMESVQFVGNEV